MEKWQTDLLWKLQEEVFRLKKQLSEHKKANLAFQEEATRFIKAHNEALLNIQEERNK